MNKKAEQRPYRGEWNAGRHSSSFCAESLGGVHDVFFV